MCDDVKEMLVQDACDSFMATQPSCDTPTYTFGGNQITKITLCDDDPSPIYIQWVGEHNMREAHTSDCGNTTYIGDGPIDVYTDVRRTMTAAELGAPAGTTRYFRSTDDCENARLEVSCPSVTAPDEDPTFTM